jgi:NADPH-dependent curcumin reductase CurA
MLPKHYTKIVLAERPKTNITPTTFRKETVAFDLKPGPGEVLVRVDWLSLDPAMRGWIREVASYIEPVRIGAVMRATGLATVIEAGEGSELSPGDIVTGFTGESRELLDALLPVRP